MNREQSYRRAMARRQRRKNKKSFVLLTSLILLLVLTAAVGTVAYLVSRPDTLVNTFIPGEVPNEIVEKFESNVKKDVQIKNTGNVDAYIRAEVVVTWAEVDADGKFTGNIHGTVPEPGIDYEWYPNDGASSNEQGNIGNGWKKGSDGRYYYISKVAPDDTTGILFTNCKPLIDNTTGKTPNQPEGYVLSVEIMGQSIQADGVNSEGISPVVIEWGTENGGSVTAVNTDKTLSIQNGN